MNSEPEKLRFLVSYACEKNFDWPEFKHASESGSIDLLIDCGAFTFDRLGKPRPSVEQYCEWLAPRRDWAWGYFALDVMNNPTKTLENYRRMLELGFQPIPILQPGGTLKHLDEYCETAEVIALAGVRLKKWFAYMARAVAAVRKRGRHAHLLGCSHLEQLKKLRPYSCDSSTFANGHRYGWLVMLEGTRIRAIHRRDVKKLTPEQCLFAKRCGVSPRDLMDGKNWRGSSKTHVLKKLAYSTWTLLCQRFARRGTRIFLVVVGKEDYNDLIATRERLRQSQLIGA